jgi:hypothetical protein
LKDTEALLKERNRAKTLRNNLVHSTDEKVKQPVEKLTGSVPIRSSLNDGISQNPLATTTSKKHMSMVEGEPQVEKARSKTGGNSLKRFFTFRATKEEKENNTDEKK